MNWIREPFTFLFIALAFLAAPSLEAAEELQVMQSGLVSYVSGGVGEEERDRIVSLGRDFNLKLMFATRTGAYVSDVNIVLIDGRGQRQLDAKVDGPLFYAKLPVGRYRIEASANGTMLHRSIVIAARGQRTVDLRWDD